MTGAEPTSPEDSEDEARAEAAEVHKKYRITQARINEVGRILDALTRRANEMPQVTATKSFKLAPARPLPTLPVYPAVVQAHVAFFGIPAEIFEFIFKVSTGAASQSSFCGFFCCS